MTSYLIDKFAHRATHMENLEPTCIFCKIISGELPGYKVYEDETTIAILDIQPIRRGHALVIPKVHIKRLSDLPPELAGAVGTAVSRVASAICRALDIGGLNVVCNQEYAQAVPHVHYHIVPAPSLIDADTIPEPDTQSQALSHHSVFSQELKRRPGGELDDLEGTLLAEKIKARL